MGNNNREPSLPSPTPEDPALGVPGSAAGGEAALVRAEMEEVLEELVGVRKKRRRHALWALLGFSPAAVIPALGLLMEGSLGLLILFSILITTTQAVGWSKAVGREKELEELFRRLEEEV